MVDADFHVRLARLEARRREVEEREDILCSEVLDLQDRREAAIARMLRAREVLEQPWKLSAEPFRVQR